MTLAADPTMNMLPASVLRSASIGPSVGDFTNGKSSMTAGTLKMECKLRFNFGRTGSAYKFVVSKLISKQKSSVSCKPSARCLLASALGGRFFESDDGRSVPRTRLR